MRAAPADWITDDRGTFYDVVSPESNLAGGPPLLPLSLNALGSPQGQSLPLGIPRDPTYDLTSPVRHHDSAF